ncbi:hypothetical protein J4E86_007579 [Alternaria arbusti]|uniref:uncharacterized protein n=1 Tax=Alternaria arbusti TaxID=232088 RepID=UPI00221EC327|nr:uncharacterized protein J4E86_007579 [Alternaria arbusti]KAI4951070.1 hypothetical protein J4E86_007579 [Alternaria arbusti]
MVDFVNEQPPLLLRDFRARIIDKPSTTNNQTKRLSINRHNGEFEFPRVWTVAREDSDEARKHKLKTLVPAPRSFFMDVKCPGCFTITTVFSHANTVVVCQGCSQVLCQPTGGKARLTEGCSFRRK